MSEEPKKVFPQSFSYTTWLLIGFILGTLFTVVVGMSIKNLILDNRANAAEDEPFDLFSATSFEPLEYPCQSGGYYLGEDRTNFPALRHLVCLEDGDIVHYKQGMHDERAKRTVEAAIEFIYADKLDQHFEYEEQRQITRYLCNGGELIAFEDSQHPGGDVLCLTDRQLLWHFLHTAEPVVVTPSLLAY